jgi:hypothetical protein
MIWAILIFLGIPLWFCAMGILMLYRNNRSLRKRPGNVAVRVKPPGKTRWIPGHAVWVHDVLAFRASPAAWKELLVWVTAAAAREPTAEEAKKLHRLGDDKVVAALETAGGGTIEIAARAENRKTLLGPFVDTDAGRSEQMAEITRLARPPAKDSGQVGSRQRHSGVPRSCLPTRTPPSSMFGGFSWS